MREGVIQLHQHLHSLNRQHRGVILRLNRRPLLRCQHHAGDLSRKQLALIARAIGAAIEAPVEGVAEFLQQGAGGQVHIQQAVIELVGIHIDALASAVAAGRIGGEGASQFAIGAQIHRDLQAAAAEVGDQVLQIGRKGGRIGAGMAEDIGEQGMAVGIAEQVAQVAPGLGQSLLPDRCRFGMKRRIAAREYVLLRNHSAAVEAGVGGFFSCHLRRHNISIHLRLAP